MHLDGKLDIPGFAVLPEAMPTNLLEDPPATPSLNQLVAIKAKSTDGNLATKIMMPEDIIKLWYSHSDFGDEFKALC